MESKRLGLCQKSLFVVPNHLTEQWASEFLQLYPAANVLVATRKDFETKNRKKFCGRIATGESDAVIIGHSQFEKIPMSAERQRAILEQQMDEILMGINEAKAQTAEGFLFAQNVADLHGAAGGDHLAGRGNADGPHQGSILDLQRGGQIDQRIVHGVHRPVLDGLEGGNGGVQHIHADLGIGLGFLVGEEFQIVLGQLVEEIHLLGDVGQLLAAGLQQGCDGGSVDGGILHALADIGLSHFRKLLGSEGAEVGGVEVGQLFNVENGGGLGNAGDVESLYQFIFYQLRFIHEKQTRIDILLGAEEEIIDVEFTENEG